MALATVVEIHGQTPRHQIVDLQTVVPCADVKPSGRLKFNLTDHIPRLRIARRAGLVRRRTRRKRAHDQG